MTADVFLRVLVNDVNEHGTTLNFEGDKGSLLCVLNILSFRKCSTFARSLGLQWKGILYTVVLCVLKLLFLAVYVHRLVTCIKGLCLSLRERVRERGREQLGVLRAINQCGFIRPRERLID